MAEPWEVPPARIQGCPVVGDLVVNVDLWVPGVIGRSYGELLWGDEVYGDIDDDAGWLDVSSRVYGVEVIRGAPDGRPIVPVHQATISLHDDPDDPVFPMDPTTEWPLPGAVVRVALSRPTDPDPLTQFVGRIESVYDDHSQGSVRDVTLQAFGMVADLSVNIPSLLRGDEDMDERVAAIMALVDWSWDPVVEGITTETVGQILQSYNVNARQLMDATGLSIKRMFDTSPAGRLRFREWPMSLQPVGAALEVTDCKGQIALASPSIVYLADTAELLNDVSVQNQNYNEQSTPIDNPSSIVRFGRRTNGLGFPLTGLFVRNQTNLDLLAQRALDAYDYVVVRVEAFEADSGTDDRWINEFPDFDTGRQVTVTRTGFDPPVSITGRICGYTLRLVRGRATATIELTATTETVYVPPGEE